MKTICGYGLAGAYAADSAALGSIVTRVRCGSNESYPFDPEKARALFQQASAVGSSLDFLIQNSRAPLARFGQIYQADLAAVGVRLNLRPLDNAAFTAETGKRNTAWLATTVSAFNQLEPASWALTSSWATVDKNDSGFLSEPHAQIVQSAATEQNAATHHFSISIRCSSR